MKLQVRVLYREFLLRLVDLELLSPDAMGDADKLRGRIAGFLGFFSLYLGLAGLLFDGRNMSPAAFRIAGWGVEHFLISTTMLIVGLFAVFSWDSTFPDLRDVLVLAPLPIRTPTFFLAKVAAVGTGLALAIGVFNAGPGLTFPASLSSPNPSFRDMLLPFAHRTFIAYWVTMAAAGTFLFCCVLSLQGFAALLPRRVFLRVSALLQLAAFCAFATTYFLEPSLATPAALGAPGNQRCLAWLPDYWFLGLFQQLNGTPTPETVPLAYRAWIGLAAAAVTTAAAYGICYVHTLRKVAEEPGIVAGARRFFRAPRFGTPVRTAIVQFSIRALARSRHHRIILAFYLGIGFALTILLSRLGPGPAGPHAPLPPANFMPIISDIMILCFWVVGTRIIFTLPLDLRANWVFRIMPLRGGRALVSATRFSLYLLGWLPVWAVSAAWFLSSWPLRMAVGHLVAFGLMGALLVELCLYRFQKIPFTCSWLPGKSNILFAFGGFSLLLMLLLIKGAGFELYALSNPRQYLAMTAILIAAAAATRWQAARLDSGDEPIVQFEEEERPVLQGLGLFRDGVLPAEPAGPQGSGCSR
ncbi:MAG: hypothetical protein JST11_06625 [Acidobacteria bacterium]|nr:hypothetical protein [Acidobacteriota bacterium]